MIALLALLAPVERRASILNFSLLPTQLSWFVGPICGAALAHMTLRLPFFAGSGLLALAVVLSALAGLAARHSAEMKPDEQAVASRSA